ncbi:hypothetical protein [Spiroplasma tabanidicola]|uniref:Uncharacterized protein n=1 Tax=Spiroplasma tabanidicola TaxID=324079 RepID=A0A6I6CBH8_9MOLU|nr:hypothetical protein [Spiroplasma tabanidicola]QGS51538.1 hypothetical protein STABA_v1c01710 [Spiroplasma tabanidicola]
MNAGYWKRYAMNVVNALLIFMTLGVYFIICCIRFWSGEKNMGMYAASVSYSDSSAMGKLFLCRILEALFCILFIPLIINFITIIMKKGTFAERWANNFFIED